MVALCLPRTRFGRSRSCARSPRRTSSAPCAASWIGVPTGYAASKAAMWSASNSLRLELRSRHTEVIALHVGMVDTPMSTRCDMPKTSATSVVEQAYDGLRKGALEVLADELTRDLKSPLKNDTTRAARRRASGHPHARRRSRGRSARAGRPLTVRVRRAEPRSWRRPRARRRPPWRQPVSRRAHRRPRRDRRRWLPRGRPRARSIANCPSLPPDAEQGTPLRLSRDNINKRVLKPVPERADELLAGRRQHPLPRGVTPAQAEAHVCLHPDRARPRPAACRGPARAHRPEVHLACTASRWTTTCSS
jgi:hypothetical protein